MTAIEYISPPEVSVGIAWCAVIGLSDGDEHVHPVVRRAGGGRTAVTAAANSAAGRNRERPGGVGAVVGARRHRPAADWRVVTRRVGHSRRDGDWSCEGGRPPSVDDGRRGCCAQD